jgi:hypothetical protein
MGYSPHLSEDSKTKKVPSPYPTCDKNVWTYLANKVSVPLLNDDRGVRPKAKIQWNIANLHFEIWTSLLTPLSQPPSEAFS